MNRTHLKSLSIKNFRIFDHLEIDNFSQINILLGKNNTGKTSVLESIFMLAGIASPQIALDLHLMRGFPNLSKEGLQYLFHDFKTDNHPIISGVFSRETSRMLEILPFYKKEDAVTITQNVALHSIPLPPQLFGLDFFATIRKQSKQGESFQTGFRFENSGKINYISNSTYKEDIFAFFLHSNVQNAYITNYLEFLLKEKKEHLLNDILNKFNQDFKEVIPMSDGVYINNSKIEKLIPLKLMGGGIQRFLNIVTAIAGNGCDNFICLIDEIENGLHYNAQRLLWKSLFSLIHSTNIQLFITTHSWEMLQSLNRVVKSDAYKNMMNNIKIFTVEHTKSNGFQSYSYSAGGLDTIISNEVEIR